jgi:hypothetical protein
MKHSLVYFLPLLFLACTSKPSIETTPLDSIGGAIDSISRDSALVEPTKETSLSHLPDLALPLQLDSAFITKREDTLSYIAIRKMLLPFQLVYTEEAPTHLIKAIEIDSLKRIGKYEAYLNSLDIAQTAQAEAYLIGKCIVNNFTIVFWKTHFRTIDADPFAEGYNLYATTFKDLNQSPISTALVGFTLQGMDPPFFMRKALRGVLNKDGAFYLSENGEQGEMEAMEPIETDYVLRINAKGIITK